MARALSPDTRGRRRRIASGSRSSLDWATTSHSSSAHCSLPSSSQATFEHLRELEQVDHVLPRVGDLLGRQRAGVPAGEARGLGQPQPQQGGQQRVVGALGPESREPGGDLGVEHVRDLGPEAPAQQGHVLAPGVHHHAYLRVGQDIGQRRAVEVVLEGVEDHDPLVGSLALGNRQLDQAQQRPVAPLAHELGVQSEPPGGSRTGGQLAQSLPLCGVAHGSPTRAGATLGGSWPTRQQAWTGAATVRMSRGSVCPAGAAVS